MVKKLLVRIWHLIELGIKEWYNYIFRKRNIFSYPLILVTTQLMAELPELAIKDYLDPLYKYITHEYGIIFGILVEVFGDFITGNYLVGFSYTSISIKLCLIILFSFLAKSKDGGTNITFKWFWGWDWQWNWSFIKNLKPVFNFNSTRIDKSIAANGTINNSFNFDNSLTINNSASEFICDQAWLEDINDTYKLNENKYVGDLYVQSELEIQLINRIDNFEKKVSEFVVLLTSCKESVAKLGQQISSLDLLIGNKNNVYKINTESGLYDIYKSLPSKISKINSSLQQIKEPLKGSQIKEIISKHINFTILDSEFGRLVEIGSFDLIEPKINMRDQESSLEKQFFDIVISIANSIDKLNRIMSVINEKKNQITQNLYIVHASGGVGKTYFAAHIYRQLKSIEHFPILIPGSAFSGNYASISHAFQNIFKYPDSFSLKFFLSKLNDFAQNNGKRIVVIIDGVNETTNLVGQFSKIWKDGIENLKNIISEFENLTFLITCRTSYIENNLLPNSLLQNSFKLSGFEDFEIRKKAIIRYFEYYKLVPNSVTAKNSRLFFIPLILKIYCESKNRNRTTEVRITLNHNSYEEALFDFVQTECEDIAFNLGRPSPRPIINAIFRNSQEFINEVSASMKYDTFLELSQGEPIDKILNSTSIGLKFLESEHLFMKDTQPYFTDEKVVHTFQNVGGYLLAEFLVRKYLHPVDFVMSNEFNSHLSGAKKERVSGKFNSKSHQLALDIMQFIVFEYSKNLDPDYFNDLIDYSQDPLVLEYSWRFIDEFNGYVSSARLEKKLKSHLLNINTWDGLLEQSLDGFLDKDSRHNFEYIKDLLLNIKPTIVELAWVKITYERYGEFYEFLNFEIEKYNESQKDYAIEFTIWLLESTVHSLRDRATLNLLEYSIKEPNIILSKLQEYSNTGRLYIYERLAGIAYGVCLRCQNDQAFVESELRLIAETVYKLQFGANPTAPSYHYIVIDSFKHIIDLAVHLNVFEIPAKENERFGKYKFNPPDDWQNVTDEEIESVSLQWTSGPDPDPLSGDFVVYTIPRLLSSKTIDYRDAVAHIYKRLLNNGYVPNQDKEMPKGVDRDFYLGISNYGMQGKVDRLGKKYSWNSFYEYAGYLLNIGKLDVFYDGSDDSGTNSYYQRLTDVKIEVSNASRSIDSKKVLSTSLIKDRGNSENWTEIEQFGILDDIYTQKFESDDFTLLYGYFEEGEKKDLRYNMRSFLLVESFLVKREDIKGKENEVFNKTMDWSDDIYRGSNIRNAYFGELYWADSIAVPKPQMEYIPSTEMTKIIHRASPFISKWENDPPPSGVGMEPVKIPITVEPSLVGYSWISDSEVYNSHTCNVPSPMIGKYLKLKADTDKMHILDKNLKRAFISFEYDLSEKVDQGLDKIIEQNSDYMRTDLLKKYLDDKGLVLMYQIKQHTFDDMDGESRSGVDLRAMQFKIHEFK